MSPRCTAQPGARRRLGAGRRRDPPPPGRGAVRTRRFGPGATAACGRRRARAARRAARLPRHRARQRLVCGRRARRNWTPDRPVRPRLERGRHHGLHAARRRPRCCRRRLRAWTLVRAPSPAGPSTIAALYLAASLAAGVTLAATAVRDHHAQLIAYPGALLAVLAASAVEQRIGECRCGSSPWGSPQSHRHRLRRSRPFARPRRRRERTLGRSQRHGAGARDRAELPGVWATGRVRRARNQPRRGTCGVSRGLLATGVPALPPVSVLAAPRRRDRVPPPRASTPCSSTRRCSPGTRGRRGTPSCARATPPSRRLRAVPAGGPRWEVWRLRPA